MVANRDESLYVVRYLVEILIHPNSGSTIAAIIHHLRRNAPIVGEPDSGASAGQVNDQGDIIAGADDLFAVPALAAACPKMEHRGIDVVGAEEICQPFAYGHLS
jgi:hypothetical protein